MAFQEREARIWQFAQRAAAVGEKIMYAPIVGDVGAVLTGHMSLKDGAIAGVSLLVVQKGLNVLAGQCGRRAQELETPPHE